MQYNLLWGCYTAIAHQRVPSNLRAMKRLGIYSFFFSLLLLQHGRNTDVPALPSQEPRWRPKSYIRCVGTLLRKYCLESSCVLEQLMQATWTLATGVFSTIVQSRHPHRSFIIDHYIYIVAKINCVVVCVLLALSA